MKTKHLKIYVYAKQFCGTNTVEVTSDKNIAKYTCPITGHTNALLSEVFIEIPDFDELLLKSILQDAVLNRLVKERAALLAVTESKVSEINKQITELKYINSTD
jgi:hypothetical protein